MCVDWNSRKFEIDSFFLKVIIIHDDADCFLDYYCFNNSNLKPQIVKIRSWILAC